MRLQIPSSLSFDLSQEPFNDFEMLYDSVRNVITG